MAREDANINDRLYRTRSRNSAEDRTQPAEERRKRQIRSWIIVVAVALAVLLGIRFLGGNKKREIGAVRLPCYSNQNVTAFGDGVLYYDGASIHCLSSTGTIRWSFPIGPGATFRAGPTHLAVWSGAQLFFIDRNGHSTYNETMEADVQFARVGERYVAVVVGEDTEPKLIVKNTDGSQVDVEAEAFSQKMILDTGFYGDQGQYLWTLSLDVFGTKANTVLNTFQVGKMNTGEISLGEYITYRIIYENGKLRVFNTQQMTTYDYKCVQETNATMLVYGWKLIDADIPDRGQAKMLLAPTAQTSSTQEITELRVLEGSTDKRYTLPDRCVGASIYNGSIYAYSGRYLFRADVSSQRFFSYALPLPDNTEISAFYGVTSDGRALLASGDTVYSLSLPQ